MHTTICLYEDAYVLCMCVCTCIFVHSLHGQNKEFCSVRVLSSRLIRPFIMTVVVIFKVTLKTLIADEV